VSADRGYNGFILSLDSVEGGSSPEAVRIFPKPWMLLWMSLSGMERNDKVLIIITDGENHEGDPVKAAMAAKKDGRTIYTPLV
jgi:Ca-activated chloride channel family protein